MELPSVNYEESVDGTIKMTSAIFVFKKMR